MRLKDFQDGFVQLKRLTGVFPSQKRQFKNSYQFQLTSWNRSSAEDGFWLLVSSDPLLRFQLVISRDLANLGMSSSGIWPFWLSHLSGFGHSRLIIFWDQADFEIDFPGTEQQR
jgi:hypothetical protein